MRTALNLQYKTVLKNNTSYYYFTRPFRLLTAVKWGLTGGKLTRNNYNVYGIITSGVTNVINARVELWDFWQTSATWGRDLVSNICN
jgi:hypothetical protein